MVILRNSYHAEIYLEPISDRFRYILMSTIAFCLTKGDREREGEREIVVGTVLQSDASWSVQMVQAVQPPSFSTLKMWKKLSWETNSLSSKVITMQSEWSLATMDTFSFNLGIQPINMINKPCWWDGHNGTCIIEYEGDDYGRCIVGDWPSMWGSIKSLKPY